MAIIVCPNCGKRVTDRMEKCPHCHAVLIEQVEQPIITKEKITASAKDSFVGVAVAVLLTIVLVLIVSVVSTICAGKFIGNEAAMAVGAARSVFFSKNLIILLLGDVLFCILSAFFNKKSATQFVIGIIITILFCILGFAIQNSAIMKSNISEPYFPQARSLSLGFGFAFPMVLGGLSLASYNRTLKKALVLQGVLSAVFFVLSVVLSIPLILVFGMATGGISLAYLVSAIALFGFALFTNKDFQTLITPKKLA